MLRTKRLLVGFLLAFGLINFSASTKCGDHTSCTQCVTSSCYWCGGWHKCTDDPTVDECSNDIVISGVNSTRRFNATKIRNGPEFCIAIKSSGDAEILVPQSIKKSIKVKIQTKSLPSLMVQSRFRCQINVDGNVTSVNGQLIGDTIYCDEIHFPAVSGEITAPFNVAWGGDKLLDNPDNVHVVIYDCSSLAEDSEKCLDLNSKFQCGWCLGSTKCEIQSNCSGNEVWKKHRDTTTY